MYINQDYSYINANEKLLIEKGYGKLSVHSIHFDRHYTEEQKENNRRTAETMTSDEWSKHCDEISKSFEKPMMEILHTFTEKYDIHQVSEETSTYEHYASDWDLYFWTNTEKNHMDYFKLNFNKKRNPEQNMKLLEEIIAFVETMEYENIGCRIQYDAVIDEKRVETEVKVICEQLAGKFITYCGFVGKIKSVGEYNGIKKYGFFKKGAKNKYYKISNTEILAMNM